MHSTNGSARSLRGYLDMILSERAVTRHYARGLRARLDAFSAYLGHVATLDNLTSDTINAYTAHLDESTAWLPKTRRDYQAVLILIWREAFERRDLETPPWRLRRVKVPRRIVQAWTLDELRAILAASKWLRGDVPGTLIRKRDWFRAFIPSAYYTGLRRCDLMNQAKRRDLREDVLTVVEAKTLKVTARRLPADVVDALRLVWSQSDSEFILPWPGKTRRFYASFKVMVSRAGVTPGGPHKIRKSAGSYAQRNGNGQALLGHEDAATFHRHYHDRSISQQVPELPPEL